MSLWDRICIHACYHRWNPAGAILTNDWAEAVWRTYGLAYPGWRAIR